MRTREIWLLLLLVMIVVSYRGTIIESAGAIVPAPAVEPLAFPAGDWRYDPGSRYYSFLPNDARRFHSPHPVVAADAVCRSLGGRVDFLQPSAGGERLGFNCKFHEPDLTITTDFGDLRRMPTNFD